MTAQYMELSTFACTVRRFLAELDANNNRGWFRAQKARYDQQIKRPAERLIEQVAPGIEQAIGQPVRTKLFRPHRDVRFSEDKTPYHTHLHASWTVTDGRGWYLGLSTDYATAGAGIMSFDLEQLDHWREAVSSEQGAELCDILEALGGRIEPPVMERVPDPYDPDHPRAELLRRKGLIVWYDDLYDDLSQNPEATLAQIFDRLTPMQLWLARHL